MDADTSDYHYSDQFYKIINACSHPLKMTKNMTDIDSKVSKFLTDPHIVFILCKL